MSTTATEQTTDSGEQTGQQTPAETQNGSKQSSLEELLAALPDDQRGVILGEVTKARSEAKNLRERLKAAEPKAAELDKLTEAQKTEQQKAAEALTAAEQRAVTAETKLLRYDVATAKKLDPDLIQFLNAGTREELEAQADALLEKFGQAKTPPNLGQGVRNGSAAQSDMNTMLRRAAGRA